MADEEQNKLSWWGEMQNEIDYYFVYGDDMDDVISGYRTLTGKSQIMPKWAMGYWQSREKYNTREEVLSTLKEFRERQIPIDNIVIDWLHWKQNAWGSHEFDPERFPDPKRNGRPPVQRHERTSDDFRMAQVLCYDRTLQGI